MSDTLTLTAGARRAVTSGRAVRARPGAHVRRGEPGRGPGRGAGQQPRRPRARLPRPPRFPGALRSGRRGGRTRRGSSLAAGGELARRPAPQPAGCRRCLAAGSRPCRTAVSAALLGIREAARGGAAGAGDGDGRGPRRRSSAPGARPDVSRRAGDGNGLAAGGGVDGGAAPPVRHLGRSGNGEDLHRGEDPGAPRRAGAARRAGVRRASPCWRPPARRRRAWSSRFAAPRKVSTVPRR